MCDDFDLVLLPNSDNLTLLFSKFFFFCFDSSVGNPTHSNPKNIGETINFLIPCKCPNKVWTNNSTFNTIFQTEKNTKFTRLNKIKRTQSHKRISPSI